MCFMLNFYSRMLCVYTPSQKYDALRLSLLRDIKKSEKKINHIKDVNNIYFAS